MKPGQGYQIKMLNSRSLQYPASMGREIFPASLDLALQKTSIVESPPWYFTNTGASHTIVLQTTTNPKIDGISLVAGDFIGVFYDSSGTMACAGYEQWTGAGNIALAAFGDDATTPAKDGLTAGEVFRWKMWRQSDARAFVATATYLSTGSLSGIVTDSDKYAVNGISGLSALNGSLTAVNQQELPTRIELSQNYPNPFNPSTIIRHGLPTKVHVSLEVYNTLGQRAAVLVNDEREAGYHEVGFEDLGIATGVYFYRLQAGSFVETKKLLLVH